MFYNPFYYNPEEPPRRKKGPSVWPKDKATLKRRAKNQAARKARKKNRRK